MLLDTIDCGPDDPMDLRRSARVHAVHGDRQRHRAARDLAAAVRARAASRSASSCSGGPAREGALLALAAQLEAARPWADAAAGALTACLERLPGRAVDRGRSRICFRPMAYVIAEPCIGTKDNSCVEVCPVDCIHPTPDEPDYDTVEQLYIDPEECIDCDACVEACPVDACFAEDQLPDEWPRFSQVNEEYYTSAK